MARKTALVLMMACLPAAAGLADPPAGAAAQPQASIAFANHGGIYDWRVIDDRTVLIEALDRQWYKATLMSPCINLTFAQRLGFETNPDGSFDKFSAIRLHHQICPLTSLVKTAPPGKKSKRHPSDVTTPAAPSAPPAPAPH